MTKRIVTDEAVEDALNELARLDEREAELKASRDYGEAKAKEIYSRHYLAAEGTINERDAKARTSEEYIEHMESMRMVIEMHQKVKNKRDTLTMVKEVWQSEGKNIRERT